MATTQEQLEQLQKEVRQLKSAQTEMRRILRAHGLWPQNGGRVPARKGMTERERVREMLRRGGVLRELTPEEKALASEWRALPEVRKQAVMRRLETVRFDPSLSETVIRDRG